MRFSRLFTFGKRKHYAALKLKLLQGIATIKTSLLGRKVPCYLVLGATQSGKSTLINSSQLEFPLTDTECANKVDLQESSDCSWHFADTAVFLETPGRYIDDVSSGDEWIKLTRMLRKKRHYVNLRAVLLIFSLTDLISEAEFEEYLTQVRKRIAQLYSNIGTMLPVILVLTKFDTVNGFGDYFNAQDKRSCFGAAINPEKDLTSQLEGIYSALQDDCLSRLVAADSIATRQRICSFPQQYRAAIPSIDAFVNRLAKTNAYYETPNVVALYFTGNGYFNYELLQNRIHNYDVKHALTRSKINMHRKMFWLSMVGAGIGVVLWAVLLRTIYLHNRDSLQHGRGLIVSLRESQTPALLHPAFSYYSAVTNYQRTVPSFFRLGLFRSQQLLPLLQHELVKSMGTLFVTPLGDYLNQQLHSYAQRWPQMSARQRQQVRASYYLALKTYLLLCYPSQQIQPQAQQLFNYYCAKLFANHYVPSSLINELTSFYLQHPQPLTCNRGLAQLARNQLSANSNSVEYIYIELVSATNAQGSAVTLDSMLAHKYRGLLISRAAIPGIYTKVGWQQYIKPALNHISQLRIRVDWTLRVPFDRLKTYSPSLEQYDSVQLQQLQSHLKQLYFMRYRNVWLDFLNSLRVKPFTSIGDARRKMSALVSIGGALPIIIAQFLSNYNVGELQPLFLQVSLAVTKGLQNYLQQMIKVENEIQPLSESGAQLQSYVENVFASAASSELYKSAALVTNFTENIEDEKTRTVLKNLFLLPIREVWCVVLRAREQQLNLVWKEQIYAYYQANIANRFPLNRAANSDLAVADFITFMAPNSGIFWKFMRHNLQPLLFCSNGVCESQRWLGVGVNFSTQALCIFKITNDISQDLFLQNSVPRIEFVLYPEPTPGVSSYVLNLAGKSLHYYNGPQEWHSFSWQYRGREPNSYLSASVINGSNPQVLQASGAWSFLHMLSHAKLHLLHKTLYRLIWHLKSDTNTYPINILMRDSSGLLQKLLLQKYILPQKLIDYL